MLRLVTVLAFPVVLASGALGCLAVGDVPCNVDGDCASGELCTAGVCRAAALCPAVFLDADGDGHGNPTAQLRSCDTGGVAAVGDDCDDADAGRSPGAAEVPGDGIDQDCDGRERCFTDNDLDGHGATTPVDIDGTDCTAAGHAPAADDCDDDDEGRFPGNPEVGGDGIDQDCDDTDVCFLDEDDDGFGGASEATNTLGCDDGVHVALGGDCQDLDQAIHPGAAEGVADGVDQDCDGQESCFTDGDLDGHGSGALIAIDGLDCDSVSGAAGSADDCDDGRGDVHPGAGERTADGLDQDCDGFELCFTDNDQDGFGASTSGPSPDASCSSLGVSATTGDCDDVNGDVYPGAVEDIADGVDQDCDGVDACFEDLDRDGFGSTVIVDAAGPDCDDVSARTSSTTGDCRDDDGTVNPDAVEIPGDGIDEDCDEVELCYRDHDRDGFGSPSTAPVPGPFDCSASGLATNRGDCNDETTGSAGQSCNDGLACTTDVCSPTGTCAGVDDGDCNCPSTTCIPGAACCDTTCANGGCPTCDRTRCALSCAGISTCNANCRNGGVCAVTGNPSQMNATCQDATCAFSPSSVSIMTSTCTASTCTFSVPSASQADLTCRRSSCNAALGLIGIASVACEQGSVCTVSCVPGSSGSVTVDATSRALIVGGCNVACDGNETTCGPGVRACNMTCQGGG